MLAGTPYHDARTHDNCNTDDLEYRALAFAVDYSGESDSKRLDDSNLSPKDELPSMRQAALDCRNLLQAGPLGPA